MLARRRQLPEEKQETRWEKFAKEKGIDNKKRSRKVFDEETDEWKARYGMGSKRNEEMSYPIMEADKDDPFANPWEKLREAKKTRVEENTARRGKNLERAGKQVRRERGGRTRAHAHEHEHAHAHNIIIII